MDKQTIAQTVTQNPAHKAAPHAMPPDSITVRAAEPSDATAISALMGSTGAFEGTQQMPHAAIASRLERFSKTDDHSVRLVAVHSDAKLGAERVIAHAGLFVPHTSPRRMHVRGLGIAVAKDAQGQGVGERMVRSLLDWADNWAGVLRIELTVYTDNARAIALYQRHGFVQEGIMRAYALRDGVYADTLAMARLHPKQPLLVKA
jgi:L-phenylalanine/L-methionine N-acetyltransferase